MARFKPHVTVKADGETLFSRLPCNQFSITPNGGEATKYEVVITPSPATRVVQALCVVQTIFAMAFLLSMQGCNSTANATTTGTIVALGNDATINATEDVAAYLCEDILELITTITDGPEWPFTE
jgi:hypothetical protein